MKKSAPITYWPAIVVILILVFGKVVWLASVPQDRIRGAIIATNHQQTQELEGFFETLKQNQHYQTVALLLDVEVSNEIWYKTLTPLIAKNFPNANFYPVSINKNDTSENLQKLAANLAETLPNNTLLITPATPQTSNDPAVAEFQLEFTKNVLENFDNDKITNLPFNNTASIQVFQKYLQLRHAQKIQNQLSDPATGSFLSFAMDGPPAQNRKVFIVAFGDVMLDRLVRSYMNRQGLDYPFQKMDISYLKANDILVANLEGPIAKKRILTSKSIAFRFEPDIVPILEKYFFDALSEANNHARDMGDPGFNDTFDLLAPTGIKVFGDPRAVNDRSVATIDTQGPRHEVSRQSIAFLGLEEVVYKIDDAKAVAKIQELTAQGYKVIPFLHWGIEYQHKPNKRQQELAHKFIDAGAIAVIGAHPHVVQTYETYKNRPIFYSLGNAIFDQDFSPDTQEGLSVGLILSPDKLEIRFFTD